MVATLSDGSDGLDGVLADGGWRLLADCAGLPDDWWFCLSDWEADPAGCVRAFRVCDGCPVRAECEREAEGLVGRGVEVVGIWGGWQWGPIRHSGRRSGKEGHWSAVARPRVRWGGGQEPFEVRVRRSAGMDAVSGGG